MSETLDRRFLHANYAFSRKNTFENYEGRTQTLRTPFFDQTLRIRVLPGWQGALLVLATWLANSSVRTLTCKSVSPVHTTFNRVGKIKRKMLHDYLLYKTVFKFEQISKKGGKMQLILKITAAMRSNTWLHASSKATPVPSTFSHTHKRSTLSSLILCVFYSRFRHDCVLMRWTWLHTTQKISVVRVTFDLRHSTVFFEIFQF